MIKRIIVITILMLAFSVGVNTVKASTSTDENLTLNGTFQFTTSPVAGYVLTSDGTGLASWLAAAVRLDKITAATALNTIANGVNAQTWNWALDGTDTAFTFGETTAATGASNSILKINTLNTSTAQPLVITNNAVDKMYVSAEGNDLYLNANGSITDIAQLLFPGTANVGDFRIGADGGDIFWQGGGGRVLQMGSYHPTVIFGDTQTSSFPAFQNGGVAGYQNISTIILPASGRTADVGLVVRGIASQSGDLQEWQNSSNTVLLGVSATGHVNTGGTAPTQTQSAGTATVSTGSTDFAGTVTSSTTSHTYVGVTFATAYANAPFCTFSPANAAAGALIYGASAGVYVTTATTYMRINHPASTTSCAWTYHCVGR